jgi:S1-C subfamily serine protease
MIVGGTRILHAQAGGPTTRSMLDELNRETTALYRQAQTGIYRVQLPQPKWVNAFAMAAVKRWDKQLDPELRRRLEQDAANPIQAAEVAPAAPTTRPSSDSDTTTVPGEGTYIVVRPRTVMAETRDPVLGGRLQPPPQTQPAGFTPNNIGLLLDADGHILVPLYVERDALGPGPAVKLAGPDGALTTAKFIGSDRQTNLTLLQVEKPAGRPVRLGSSRPEAGALVMCLATTDGAGRLSIWSDGGAQENGVILTTDGQVAGIARYGQFLTGSACRLIARQLIEYGSVRRATLGVLITEIRRDDLPRRQQPVLGVRSAMRIDQVIANSAADKAGLRAGDLVLAVGGEPVSDLPSFAAAIAARNGPTELQVLRGEAVMKVSVDLQQQK